MTERIHEADQRKSVVSEAVDVIDAVDRLHPVRVAVDGRTASGKTTFADELATELRERDREVIRTSIDGFHQPQAKRYARGRHSAEGYYYDARDLGAVRELLLDPLGPSGDRRYRVASFDLDEDKPIDLEPSLASTDSILIVDGTFLQRPELNGCWDMALFVHVPEELAIERGTERDRARLGDAVTALYEQRYRPAFAIYEQFCDPMEIADIVLDNADFAAPTLRVRRKP